MSESNRLAGRVAVVTGAGRGIGAAVARRLAAEGASVVVNDLGVGLDGTSTDETPADEVVREIEAAGGTAVANRCDIGDYAGGADLIDAAIERFGRLDVLVNVAGILRDAMIFNMTEEQWDDVVRVHLKGHFNTIRPAAAYWRRLAEPDAHRRIINFTSGSGLYGAAGQPNYAAAKLGIVGLTYSCANALRKYGVTTNAVSPSAMTRMITSVAPEKRRTPADPDIVPENVAPLVAYLASPASAWCNGRVIGSRGLQVTLFSNPEPIQAVASDEPWDVDRLGEMMEATFRPVVESTTNPHARRPAGAPA